MDDAQSDQTRQIFLKALSQFHAEDVLTPISQVALFPHDAPLPEVLSVIKESGFSRYPVYQDGIDNIIGVLHVRSLLFVSPSSFNLEDCLNKAFVISENKKLDELFEEFNKQKTHFALVVDEHGSLRGIITMEDILESVVGGIEDEFDANLDGFKVFKRAGGHYTIDARMELNAFNAQFKTSYSSEEYDTIGGYLMEVLGRVPEEGESIILAPYTVVVTKAQGPKLLELSVSKTVN